jgi:hypothetical protein
VLLLLCACGARHWVHVTSRPCTLPQSLLPRQWLPSFGADALIAAPLVLLLVVMLRQRPMDSLPSRAAAARVSVAHAAGAVAVLAFGLVGRSVNAIPMVAAGVAVVVLAIQHAAPLPRSGGGRVRDEKEG